ncbi:MAG: Do family serine endopeptidase [Chthoniobacteraceae bacterium]
MKSKLVFFAFATISLPVLAQEADKTPSVKVDPAPVSRQAGVITSFAPVVEKVGPSVVQISTSKNVKPGARSRMFDDPFFRRFFGLPNEDEPQDEAPQPDRRDGRGGGRTQKEALGLGSGVIVSAEGHILTNSHVIDGADDILVTITGDKREYKAKRVGNDPATDLAVLQFETKPAKLKPITFGDSDKLRVGDVAVAIGNPFGLSQTVTMGIISATGRRMGIIDNGSGYEDFLQTDASINPGNSGGALVDVEGRLIGINTAIFSRTGTNLGIGFAVPVNLAHSVMDSLITNGRVVRGYLGVGLQALDDALASRFKLKSTDGTIVSSVEPKSPAAKAGLAAGDVITEINGRPIVGVSEMRMLVSSFSPGTKVNVKYLRDGNEKKAEIELAELPSRKQEMPAAKPDIVEPDVLDGVTVGDIDEQARKKFEIAEDAKGVVVIEIDDESASHAAGIRVGDVIHEIEHKALASANDAVEMSEKLKKEKELLLRVSTKGASRFVVVKEL